MRRWSQSAMRGTSRFGHGLKEGTRTLTWRARGRNEEKGMSLLVVSGCCSAPSRSR